MGLIDEKQNIFTEIGALTSIKGGLETPDSTNSISSINNTNEIIPLLLDLLIALVGSEVLQTTVGEIITTYVRNVQPTLKTSLKKQLSTYNSNESLPIGFQGGYTFPMKDIDVYEKTKKDPSSDVGGLLYSDEPNDFDRKLYQSTLIPGTPVNYNEINTSITYDDTLDTITLKPINTSGVNISDYTVNYVDNITLINEKEFTSNIVNAIFGTITTNENKTLETILKEEKLNFVLQKIINGEEDITINDDELNKLQENAQNKFIGVEYYDVGCGVIENNITLSELNLLISGTTGSTDPLTVGKAYLNTFMGGFENSDNTIASDRATEEEIAIKDSFFKRLINAIVNVLVIAITSPPQIRALLGIFSGFKNNDNPQLGDPIDYINKNQNLITCLSNSVRSTINEFLFNLIKKELIKLIIPVSKIILREKINQYIAIIRSLIKFIRS